MSEQEELKRSFSHSEMQELLKQLNAVQINDKRVFNAHEGNWKMDGMYITIETGYRTLHMFLPITENV